MAGLFQISWDCDLGSGVRVKVRKQKRTLLEISISSGCDAPGEVKVRDWHAVDSRHAPFGLHAHFVGTITVLVGILCSPLLAHAWIFLECLE